MAWPKPRLSEGRLTNPSVVGSLAATSLTLDCERSPTTTSLATHAGGRPCRPRVVEVLA